MPGDEAGSSGGEPLACVTCRSRKLKCDRIKPVCTRCAKAKIDCLYPESRRKPAFKRKNVNELEVRLAQVEELLREVGEKRTAPAEPEEDEVVTRSVDPSVEEIPSFDFSQAATEDVFFQGMDYAEPFGDQARGGPETFHFSGDSGKNMPKPFGWELMDLGGISETPPPFEVIEELHHIYFGRQQYFVPIIHPARYLKAFYGPPHMKPPMCLQYALWSMAANSTEKYRFYADIFYKRARKYLEEDEMRSHGEHFITVAHAQTWCCIATIEAKYMLFTRAAMSCSRAVRLAQMMGLHRLDQPPGEDQSMSPTLLPPRDWAELEERRRTFWGIFCIDSHCSISTGWPHLIDIGEVTTHLPAPETAFQSGEPVETASLYETLRGAPFHSFAGAIIVCHMFNRILRHIHRPKPSDHPENYEYGEYWIRHRDIDISLSSTFMYLPPQFRLPDNYRDPTAIHTNLNLHAAVICLNHASLERIETHSLSEDARRLCSDRMVTAAQEIINIVKLTSHLNANPMSPLSALALYCAASVFIYMCKQGNAAPSYCSNLDFIVAAMDSVGREHVITRAFLRQAILDIRHNGLSSLVNMAPHLVELSTDVNAPLADVLPHHIPLLARSQVSGPTGVQPPLPGRLPLGKPVGDASSGCNLTAVGEDDWCTVMQSAGSLPPRSSGGGGAGVGHQNSGLGNKRRRMSAGGHQRGGNNINQLPVVGGMVDVGTNDSPSASDRTGGSGSGGLGTATFELIPAR